MSEQTIITISREYGSYGREIGRTLAKELNIAYYDKEILENIAQNLGISASFFQDTNLNKDGLFSLPGRVKYGIKSLSELSMTTAAYEQAKEFILSLAQKESAIIVGRCANYILKDHPSHISVYCYGDLNDRVHRVIEEYKVPPNKARKAVLDTDERRAKYYEFYTHQKWGQLDDYDVTINTSKKTMEEIITMLKQLYDEKKSA